MSLSAIDRLEIYELLAIHGHIADDRRPEQLDEFLTPDAVYDITDYHLGVVRGLPALRDLFTARPGDQPVGHHVTNIVVLGHDDATAHVRSKGLAVMADGRAGTVTYEDTVTRTAAGWRVSHRKVIAPRSD